MSKKIRIILLLSCVCNALVLHAQGFRNIEFSTFVPKGQWIAGSSVSYSQSEQEDYNFLFIESVSGSEYSFKVSPQKPGKKKKPQLLNCGFVFKLICKGREVRLPQRPNR